MLQLRNKAKIVVNHCKTGSQNFTTICSPGTLNLTHKPTVFKIQSCSF